ncbi:hypothetical protein [Acetobacterium malicum]|uniref:hypothetical protein n=1 Tax=Acetobacterium malicum TaxID=52692 RepID=UPI00041B6094|nr:hypothetical protein [Acetobacterium dehalogenans]
MEKYNVNIHFIEVNIFFEVTNALYALLAEKNENELEIGIFRKLILSKSKEFANLIFRYKYPNISEYNNFWNELYTVLQFEKTNRNKNNICSIYELETCVEDELKKQSGNKILFASTKKQEDSLFSSEQGILTENLFPAYRIPTIIFYNSIHYFDNENVIKELFKKEIKIIHFNKRNKLYNDSNLKQNVPETNIIIDEKQ